MGTLPAVRGMDLEDLINGFACRFEKKKTQERQYYSDEKSHLLSAVQQSGLITASEREKHHLLDMAQWLKLVWMKHLDLSSTTRGLFLF